MKFAVFTDPHIQAHPSKLILFRDFIARLNNQVDGFICAGDWVSMSVTELEIAFSNMRGLTDKPILGVMGNHCHWVDKKDKITSLDEVWEYQKDICKKYNIVYLEEESFETENSFITGFNGWYNFNNNLTHDYEFIPLQNSYGASSFHALTKRTLDKFDRALTLAEKSTKANKVCVTHFSFTKDEYFKKLAASDRMLEVIKENFNVLISGHSHQRYDKVEDNLRMINAGADYNKFEDLFYIINL